MGNLKYLKPSNEGILQFLRYSNEIWSRDQFFHKNQLCNTFLWYQAYLKSRILLNFPPAVLQSWFFWKNWSLDQVSVEYLKNCRMPSFEGFKYFRLLIPFWPSTLLLTNHKNADQLNEMSLVERSVYGEHFVLPLYVCTLVLQEKLRWSRL